MSIDNTGHAVWHWVVKADTVVQLCSELLGLEPIDRGMSRDERSFDSNAVKACYDTMCDTRLGVRYKGVGEKSHLVSVSFDGASVMMGANDSVQQKHKEESPSITSN